MRISIPTPCKENWQTMTDVGAGRFCGKCEKTVIDFTGLTDAEIYHIISRPPGRICGRLGESQLNRTIQKQPQQSSHKRFHRLLAGLILFGIAKNTGATQNAKALTEQGSINQHPSTTDPVSLPELEDTAAVYIKGKVIDMETKQPLQHASVYIKEINKGTGTDKEGNFSLKLPANLGNNTITLSASFIGYKIVERRIKRRKFNREQHFVLPLSTDFLGEIVITTTIEQKKRGA